MNFRSSLNTFGSAGFESRLKDDIQRHAQFLPLQQGMQNGSVAFDNNVQIRIIRVRDTGQNIQIRAGIFFSSIIAGCNCSDDPTPVEEQNEYCELELLIDKQTAETTATIIHD